MARLRTIRTWRFPSHAPEMTSDASLSRTSDPISGLAVAFAASRGVVADPAARLEHIWAVLTAHGEATPGLAFASWVAPGALGGALGPASGQPPPRFGGPGRLDVLPPL